MRKYDEALEKHAQVLILIVMEDTLWEAVALEQFNKVNNGLNPYCNGRYSMSYFRNHIFTIINQSLNPYCNGRYSMR